MYLRRNKINNVSADNDEDDNDVLALVVVAKNYSQCITVLTMVLAYLYEAYSESKYRFAVKKSSKVSYKILMLLNSTLFKIFFHIFAAIIEALIVAGTSFYISS